MVSIDEKYSEIKNNKEYYQSCCSAINQEYILIGNQKKLENTLLYGHLFNDSGGNIFKDISFDKICKDKTLLKNKIIEYFTNSEKKANCLKATVKRISSCMYTIY